MAKKLPGNYLKVHEGIAEYFRRVELGFPPDAEKAYTVKNPIVLAVDPGTTNLAVALIIGDHVSTTKFESPKFVYTYTKMQYLVRMIEVWAKDILGETKIDLMVKESVAHGYAGGVADSGRMQHTLEHFAAVHRIPWIDVTPMSMRAYFKSKSKSDTKLAVFKKFGREFESEDECDVFAIGMTGIAMLRGEYVVKKK